MSGDHVHVQNVSQNLCVTLSERRTGPAPGVDDFASAARFVAAQACFYDHGKRLSDVFYRLADRLSAGDTIHKTRRSFVWRSGLIDPAIAALRAPDPKPRRRFQSLEFWAGAMCACAAFCLITFGRVIWGFF